jgi:hypothetical protein
LAGFGLTESTGLGAIDPPSSLDSPDDEHAESATRTTTTAMLHLDVRPIAAQIS